MNMISMAEAVQLLKITRDGLPGGSEEEVISTSYSDVNVLCPACSSRHQSRRATLNINFEKNLFNCPRCKFSGGVDSFVSYYTGWHKKDVENRLRAGELGQTSLTSGVFRSAETETEVMEKTLAPIVQRDEAYRGMLSMLSLSQHHKEDLIKRGLAEEQIKLLGYKSTPLFLDVTSIPKRLVAQGVDLRFVPGFGIGKSGEWEIAKMPKGFFVPGRNAAHLLQGFQIRADHPSDSIPKYSFLSSKRMPGGAACATWCHWAGADLRRAEGEKPFDVFIIEGWLKGDICHCLTGENFLCVPGTNALKKVLPALNSMRNKGLIREIMIAYDMDAYENKDVAKQLLSLFFMLKNEGYKVRILQWDSLFKGLDNWLYESGEYEKAALG